MEDAFRERAAVASGARLGYRHGMDELGDDLLLLAARSDGTLALPAKLRFGLAGSELVRLADARRVDITRGRIVILDAAPTGDQLLDEALGSMTGRRGEPAAKAWVARNRPGLVNRYLARAEAAGLVRADRRTVLGFIPMTRWRVLDTARAAQARARLTAVAESTGPVDTAHAALAGLASAIDVTRVVFPGLAGLAARKRLRQAARREPTAAGVTTAVTGAADAGTQAADAATKAAMEAAVRATTDAAVSAAVDAATQATISAADGGGHHGGAVGGHH
jgi:hypothetical protein